MANTKIQSEQIADDVALAGSPTTTTQSASDNSTKVATTAYVTTAVANLVDSAPSSLNTLNELAAAMNDNASFFSTVLPLSGGTMTGNISHASDFTLDVGGGINLDSDGGEISFKDDGTEIGKIFNSSSDFALEAGVQDKDILFRGNDGGSAITALTLDMSAAGAATFNAGAAFGGGVSVTGSGNTALSINTGNNSGDNSQIKFGDTADDDVGQINYDHGTNAMQFRTNAAANTLVMDNSGGATFSGSVKLSGLNGGNGLLLDLAGSTDYQIKEDDTSDQVRFGSAGGADNRGIFHNISSGNLLVGKAATTSTTAGTVLYSNGQIYATADQTQTAVFTRTTDDGPIVIFYKDSGEVGRIGTLSGYPTIGNSAGLLFNSGNPSISAFNANTNSNSDGLIDIGASNVRFRDLYLAGGAFIGGTGSANKLDDYEEGTWTPVLIAGTTNPTGGGALNPYGSYTKVGNRVTVTYYVGRSYTNTPAGQIYVSNLPFTVKNVNQNIAYHYVAVYNVNFGGGMTMGVPDRGATTLNLYAVNNSSSWTQIDWSSHTSSPIYLSGEFSYIVD